MQVVWYKDTMKLMETSRLHMINVGDTYKMTIVELEAADWGRYYCGASNSLGEILIKITLTGTNIEFTIDVLKSQIKNFFLLVN